MHRRALSALLCVLLLLSLLPVAAHADSVTDDDVIRAVLVVFRCREGTYDSVNRNDNGALSLGKLQWHGVRALELMKEICAADAANARPILGDALFGEITAAGRDAWNSRILDAEEGALFSRVLALPSSVKIQDTIAKKDISNYISHARTYDIRTAEAMVYYCDLENQYGPGGAADLVSRVKTYLGKSSIDTVDEFHDGILHITTNYLSRRNWTYAYCCSLNWNDLDAGGSAFDSTPVIPPNLDIEPPKITSARLVPLDDECFQVEIGAKDNKKVKDCRVQIGTDAEETREWAAYARQSGTLWALPVNVTEFSPEATRFYVVITVSDAAGNGVSSRLELSRSELSDPAAVCEHRFRASYDEPATCTEPEYRVEQCELCGRKRETVLSSPLGHDFQLSDESGYYRCTRCGALAQTPERTDLSTTGILTQAAQQIAETYQRQIEN